jgi:hypothetical protein
VVLVLFVEGSSAAPGWSAVTGAMKCETLALVLHVVEVL